MKKVPFLLALFFASVHGFAQPAETPALFVSRLKAFAEESSILLTWSNPKDGEALPLVYRHAEEISLDNLDQAELVARLEAGQSSYQDRPLNDNPHYYAVLLQDPGGAIHRYLIPFRNRTWEPVRIRVFPTEQSLATRITGIRTEVIADAIRITFTSSRAERELLLFRSTAAMLRSLDLLEAASPVQLEAGRTSYLDYPLAGIEYYYAVVDAGLFKLGQEELVSGQNSTAAPVSLPIAPERAAAAQPRQPPATVAPAAPIAPAAPAAEQPQAPEREQKTPAGGPAVPAVPAAAPAAPAAPLLEAIPPARTVSLPHLRLLADPAGEHLPADALISFPTRARAFAPETRAAAERALASAPPLAPSRQRVEILPGDGGNGEAGELGGLQRILRENLSAGDFRSAEEKLLGFLNIRRSAMLEARTRFYLAQAYYFQGLFQEALFEFVLAQEQLYAPVQPWIQSCFRMMWSAQSDRRLPD